MSYYNNLRPHEKRAIDDFIETMAYKLEKNRRKSHREGVFSIEGENERDWRNTSIYTLLDLLEGEVQELRQDIHENNDAESICNEAADVANFAMMIHNICNSKCENVQPHSVEMINILSEGYH